MLKNHYKRIRVSGQQDPITNFTLCFKKYVFLQSNQCTVTRGTQRK